MSSSPVEFTLELTPRARVDVIEVADDENDQSASAEAFLGARDDEDRRGAADAERALDVEAADRSPRGEPRGEPRGGGGLARCRRAATSRRVAL